MLAGAALALVIKALATAMVYIHVKYSQIIDFAKRTERAFDTS